MILDIEKFIQTEQPFWTELETMLSAIENMPGRRLDLEAIRRLHYLYQRASADLARAGTFAATPEIRESLESLVGHAYAVIHRARRPARLPRIGRWFTVTFPGAVRRHSMALTVSALTVACGALLGAVLLLIDPEAENVLLPPWLRNETPAERVAREQRTFQRHDPLAGHKTTLAAGLLTNNVRVSFFVAGLGVTFGLGTLLVLFHNGVMLGAVTSQYVTGGQAMFMLGWLLPHGAVEIPAIVLAGQAGLVLAAAIIGRDSRLPFYHRLRTAAPDLLTLTAGVSILLLWAAAVEAFFSQYHEPVLPYALKIAVGLFELLGLVLFLALSGRGRFRAGFRRPPDQND